MRLYEADACYNTSHSSRPIWAYVVEQTKAPRANWQSIRPSVSDVTPFDNWPPAVVCVLFFRIEHNSWSSPDTVGDQLKWSTLAMQSGQSRYRTDPMSMQRRIKFAGLLYTRARMRSCNWRMTTSYSGDDRALYRMCDDATCVEVRTSLIALSSIHADPTDSIVKNMRWETDGYRFVEKQQLQGDMQQ
jgi:hypothetical protein